MQGQILACIVSMGVAASGTNWSAGSGQHNKSSGGHVARAGALPSASSTAQTTRST